MEGKTCVVTGATSGIGRAAALQLGRLGADLVVTGRNERQGARLVGRLGRECGCPSARFIRADLSLQSEVRRLAADIADRYSRVDVLINNAGARFDRFGTTPDNIETTFATNHLSHFLLTVLLLEKLMKAGTARVITVSSGAHGAGSCDFERALREDTYERKSAYGTSKLANLIFARELARRLLGTGITSNAVDPGVAATRFAKNNGVVSWMRHLGYHALKGELVSPEKGAETIVHLATSAAVEGISGKYFFHNREASPSSISGDEEAARKLWKLSLDLTGLDERVGPIWATVKP